MDCHLEIRKLEPSHIRELANTLDDGDSWKKIMSLIPKTLEKSIFECEISNTNAPKYNSEHIRLIENASRYMQKSYTEILFDEWGTSGRIRPTLGHLLHLLIRAELFKAADYVAVKLLNKDPPERPKEGPAARVTIVLPEEDDENDEESIDSNFIAQNLAHRYESNKKEPMKKIVPILIKRDYSNKTKEVSDSINESASDMIQFSKIESVSQSDMLKFSESSSTTYNSSVPNITDLNLASNNDVSSSNNSETVEDTTLSNPNIPQISALANTLDYSYEVSDNIPNLSIINGNGSDSDVILPNLTFEDSQSAEFSSEDASLPSPSLSINKSALSGKSNTNNSQLDVSLNITAANSQENQSRIACCSPLPNLTLDTLLPHFPYCKIKPATNNFDAKRHSSKLDMNKSLSKEDGRFLGSGSFGSVYLAIGLCENPVAVKKLHLKDVAVVNIKDTVTKQFKNEVEVLSKYKHDNLLSLVGYSCDGPTYCLLYDYVPGGALDEALLNNRELLAWKDRLQIAQGTANAVSYLHTAFDTPLIHRDIKSANILLDCTKRPKLCDFGIIKPLTSKKTTIGTANIGTSAYMSPEAFRGDISVKLDTFSFGVVLLELLTGLSPVDESREGCDIVTHMGEICENNDIKPHLDQCAGDWSANGVQFGQLLYDIAVQCLEEKKRRPTMVAVCSSLENILSKCF